MSYRALIFGCTGQVGRELLAGAPEDIAITGLGRREADLSEPAACADLIATASVDAVINAAAYTNVDGAEANEDDARRINADAPTAMAEAAAQRGIPFLHLSTDYVYDGSGTAPWRPDSPTGPLNAYGRSKLAGDQGVLTAAGQGTVLRTSWVFSAHGSNFVKTMLRLGASNSTLRVVDDQIGGPTAAADIADVLFTMLRKLADRTAPGGIYHLSGAPDVSWADFAREIFRQAGIDVSVDGIPTSAYPTPAARPANSRLDCASLFDVFGLGRPDWRAALSDVIQTCTEKR